MDGDFIGGKTNDMKRLIRYKIYLDRARMYVGYFQFFLIGWVFLESIRDSKIGAFIFANAVFTLPVLFILFISGCIFIGWLEMKMGIRDNEYDQLAKANPFLRELMDKIERIENK